MIVCLEINVDLCMRCNVNVVGVEVVVEVYDFFLFGNFVEVVGYVIVG